MDKRLIDADKLLEWMYKKYYRFETKNDFFEGTSEAIKRGLFAPDPIPLPTIKEDNAGWYCPNCEMTVAAEHVTSAEAHDVRVGGCGFLVEWRGDVTHG